MFPIRLQQLAGVVLHKLKIASKEIVLTSREGTIFTKDTILQSKFFERGILVLTWDGSRERKGHVIAAVLAENVKLKLRARQ